MSGTVDNLMKLIPVKKTRAGEKTQSPSSVKQVNTRVLNDHVLIDNQTTTVAITVSTKGRKDTQKMPNGTGEIENTTEKKRRSQISNTSKNNWPGILREQNKSVIQSTLSKTNDRMSGSKTARTSGNYKDLRTSRNTPKNSLQKKSTPFPEVSTATSVHSKESTESVYVTDKAVQCGGLFDSSNHLNRYSPVRTIAFLMKELETLIKDEKSSEILFDMEQALLRIPNDRERVTPADLEVINTQARLEAKTQELAATSKQMENTVEALRKEISSLQQQVGEKNRQLDVAKRHENELEVLIKDMKDEALKSEQSSKKLMSEIKEKSDNIQVLHDLTTKLRTERNEQMELAQQRFLEAQYLKMEKEKLSVISSFKDSQLIEHRRAIKSMQSLIGDQLMDIKEASKSEEMITNLEQELSNIILAGRASSSPTRTSSNQSIAIVNGQDVADGREISYITLSSIHPINSNEKFVKNLSQKLDTIINESVNQTDKFKEKTHLEFTSIAGDELSQNLSLIKANDDEVIYIAITPDEKKDKNQMPFIYSNEKLRDDKIGGKAFTDKLITKKLSNRLINVNADNNIKEQIHMMYEKTRRNSKFEVNVPSPPRNFPHPDWSDSSLPTMSISESNLM